MNLWNLLRIQRRRKPRQGRVSDPQYLTFIAQQPCIVTGARDVTIHHLRKWGSPKDDRRTVPLVAELHMRTHEFPGQLCVERGKRVFEAFWGVDLEREIERLNALYLATRDNRDTSGLTGRSPDLVETRTVEPVG
jgi:hypothetical protein